MGQIHKNVGNTNKEAADGAVAQGWELTAPGTAQEGGAAVPLGDRRGHPPIGEIPDPSGLGWLWARRPRERKASQATARGQTETQASTQSSALTGLSREI